jgi:excisionase family DNA binding protein
VARVLVTVEQAAAALSMCRYTVNKLIATGELQSIKVGRMRRVPTGALEEFVRRRLQVDSSLA